MGIVRRSPPEFCRGRVVLSVVLFPWAFGVGALVGLGPRAWVQNWFAFRCELLVRVVEGV